MSGRRNVDIVREGFDAINRGDIDAVLRNCHPDIELRPSLVGGIEGMVYRGTAAYREWFAEAFESFDEIEFELERLIEARETVVALYVTKVRGAASGIDLESPAATVFRLRGGLVTHQIGYQRREEALEAAGLPFD